MQPIRAALRGLPPLIVAFALAAGLAGCEPRAVDGASQVVDGLEFDYGVVPAEAAQQHPADHPEAAMHGGAQKDPLSYHVTLAVLDARTRAQVSDAEVTLKLSGPGHGPGVISMPLEPMAIAGTTTYGGYVDLPMATKYDLTFEIVRPEQRDHRIRARFTYDRPD
jgi:hypothetical protein